MEDKDNDKVTSEESGNGIHDAGRAETQKSPDAPRVETREQLAPKQESVPGADNASATPGAVVATDITSSPVDLDKNGAPKAPGAANALTPGGGGNTQQLEGPGGSSESESAAIAGGTGGPTPPPPPAPTTTQQEMTATERAKLENELKSYYSTYHAGAWFWAALHYITPYLSALLIAAVVLVLKLDYFMPLRYQSDLAALLAVIAFLLTIFRVASDSSRRWRLYQRSAGEVRILKSKLTDPKAQGDDIRLEIERVIRSHSEGILGP